MEDSLTVINHKEGEMNYFFQKRFYIDECLRGSHAHLACFFRFVRLIDMPYFVHVNTDNTL